MRASSLEFLLGHRDLHWNFPLSVDARYLVLAELYRHASAGSTVVERSELVTLIALGIAELFDAGTFPTTLQLTDDSDSSIKQEREHPPQDEEPANWQQREGLVKDPIFIKRRSNRFEREDASGPDNER